MIKVIVLSKGEAMENIRKSRRNLLYAGFAGLGTYAISSLTGQKSEIQEFVNKDSEAIKKRALVIGDGLGAAETYLKMFSEVSLVTNDQVGTSVGYSLRSIARASMAYDVVLFLPDSISYQADLTRLIGKTWMRNSHPGNIVSLSGSLSDIKKNFEFSKNYWGHVQALEKVKKVSQRLHRDIQDKSSPVQYSYVQLSGHSPGSNPLSQVGVDLSSLNAVLKTIIESEENMNINELSITLKKA